MSNGGAYYVMLTVQEHQTLGWKRDLTMECVEANPGPSWEEIKKVLVDTKLGGPERVHKFFSTYLQNFEEELYKVYPGTQVIHDLALMLCKYPLADEADVLALLDGNEHKVAVEKALGEHATRVEKFIREVISSLTGSPLASTHVHSPPASTRPSSAGSVKISPMALPDDFFTQNITILDLEGLKATPWRMKRDDLCKALIKIVDDYALSRNLLLVRGPYSSGKTALAQLLHYYIRQQHTAHIVSLDGSETGWENFWFRETGVPWDTIMFSDKPVYVILDEVQMAYPEDKPLYNLWSFVKKCVTAKTQQVRFIFLGSYGEPQAGGASTPVMIEIQPKATISLRAHNGTPGLAYTFAEFDVLRVSFENFSRIPIDDRSSNFIFHISEGHPGIIGITLTCLYNNRKDFSLGDAAKDEIYRYLHSAAFHKALDGPYRAIPKFAKFDESVRALCKQVVSAESAKVPYDQFNQQLEQCLKVSLLVKEGGHVMFSAPIIKDTALAYFFSQDQPKPPSLRDLILAVVQRFSSQQLRNTASRGTNSEILEAQFQHEFFRAAASLLPRDVTISPEYGREKGTKGQVDFYIAQYQWMIEVLRDGIQIAEHERRFLPGGRYHPLLSSVEAWAVIDFRSDKKQVRRPPHSNTYHLSFNDDFTKFAMRDTKGHEEQFLVLGDQVRATQTDRTPGTTPAKMLKTETNIPK